MGRRSRARRAEQRTGAARSAPPPAPRPARLTDERPKPPWHPVPLVELSVLVGLVLIVMGFVSGIDGERGRTALLCGLALASLGGLDTALREHFAGFRSHSTLLAGLPGVVVAGVLFFARVPWVAVALGAAAAFAVAFWAFRTAFRRRSGGLSFR